MKNTNLVEIPLTSISPHPQNPRKDLGDLTELAESIRTTGILQNLTVVQNEDYTYTVIIGHRRLAAAKLAGLETVPCAVVEMSEDDQLATMLAENMQRSDLTVYEQAEGIQLLLDRSFSISDIAEKTGFSESTIRRRTKLLELDKEAFKRSQQRQVSLADYEKLNEITDIESRNKLLDVIGTVDFENELTKALNRQKVKAKLTEFKNAFEDMPNVEIFFEENSASKCGCAYEDSLYFHTYSRPVMPKLDRERKYRVFIHDDSMYIYKVLTAEEQRERSRKSEEDLRREKFHAEAEEINRRFHGMRKKFADNPPKLNSIRREILVKEFTRCVAEGKMYSFMRFAKPFDESYDKDGGVAVMLELIHKVLDDRDTNGYIAVYSPSSPRYDNPELNRFYYLINRLGYEMCTEEIQLRDGTHPIFTKYKGE